MRDIEDVLAELVRGPAGRDGRDGRDGLDGVEGHPGPMGPRGFIGKDGTHGRDGLDGKDGQDGLNGKDGAPGERGQDGVDGAAGKRGLQGLQGPQGDPGPQGPKGDIGPMPRHEWEDTRLRFEIAPGRWGQSVDLQGPAGKAGRVQYVGGGGTSESSGSGTGTGNTLRNGSGAPDDSVGIDGDFYIDSTAWRIYGPKASGAWPATTEIRPLETMTPGTISDGSAFEFGNMFLIGVDGHITGIRFYKPSGDSGFSTRTGRLWNSGGAQVASVVFASETASGWQEAALASPVAVFAAETYRVSYNTGTKLPFTGGEANAGFPTVPPSSDISIQASRYNAAVGSYPDTVSGDLVFADLVFEVGGVSLRGPRGPSA